MMTFRKGRPSATSAPIDLGPFYGRKRHARPEGKNAARAGSVDQGWQETPGPSDGQALKGSSSYGRRPADLWPISPGVLIGVGLITVGLVEWTKRRRAANDSAHVKQKGEVPVSCTLLAERPRWDLPPGPLSLNCDFFVARTGFEPVTSGL
jgi:hypothetical protein